MFDKKTDIEFETFDDYYMNYIYFYVLYLVHFFSKNAQYIHNWADLILQFW